MKKLHKPKQGILKVAALGMATALLFSACGMQGGVKTQKIGQLEEVSATYTEQKHHFALEDKWIFVAKSGLIELYLDPETYAIAVKETNTGKMWKALPAASEATKDAQTEVLSLTVSGGNKRYTLNSQDNAVAFGSAFYKPVPNGVQVTYDLALDAETANSTFDSLPADALYVSVTVEYTLVDGAMYVTVKGTDVLCSAGYKVEDIRLLNYFGATETDNAEDYIFVPDGCGAVETLSPKAEGEAAEKTFATYGENLALGAQTEAKPALLAAYGMKCGDSAFATLIEGGDAISTIQSHAKGEGDPYYRVGASFRLNDVGYNGKEGKTVRHIGNSYNGELKLCYRFLSQNNASYAGMATACRELLMRSGKLSTKSVQNTEYVPFVLAAQASVPKKRGCGVQTVTKFEELEELLSLMKAKSINNVFVRYNGALNGGFNQKKLKNNDLLSTLGNKKAFENLQRYVKTQQFTLFLNVDLLSFPSVGGSKALNLFGDSMQIEKENPFSAINGKTAVSQKLICLSAVSDGVDAFVNDKNDAAFGGYCVDDAGSLLYSDYSDADMLRLTAMDKMSQQASTLAAGHLLMVDTGNVYMLKNADIVANLPSSSAYPETASYSAVPFMQMILHGTLDYAHTSANLSDNAEAAALKALEYGALPSYSWYFEKTENEELDARYYYESQINTAAKNYETANAVLHDLRDARMTAHEKLQDGVYATEYNNSILLYFNYNKEPVTVNSITIEPMQCLRVN